MSNAGKKIIAAASEALAVARGEEPAASITVNGHTYVPAERVRTLEAELSKAREIAADILECDAWRNQWEPDYAGGSNARAKIKQIIELGALSQPEGGVR